MLIWIALGLFISLLAIIGVACFFLSGQISQAERERDEIVLCRRCGSELHGESAISKIGPKCWRKELQEAKREFEDKFA
jgi:hypothetical protein